MRRKFWIRRLMVGEAASGMRYEGEPGAEGCDGIMA